MRSERAQGTVEYVGVLLVVAALLVGLAGTVGATSVLGGAFTRAIEAAFGVGHGVAAPEASAIERTQFAAAVDPDPALTPDDRPSLGDVRLALIEHHGDERGRAIYRGLVAEEALRVVPGLAGTTRFGSLGPTNVTAAVFSHADAIERAVTLEHAVGAPQDGDPGELETPSGPPDVHVVSASEQDAAFRAALHPGVDAKSLTEDVFGAVPLLGTAEHLGSLVFKVAELASTAATLIGTADDVRQAGDEISPSAAQITPGRRAGDIVVRWTATRRNDAGRALGTVERGAVIRDGHVIETVLKPGP
jgi:hypothetical protein